MYIPKRYGQSKSNRCPFCGTEAVFKNKQGIIVCRKHKDLDMGELKCACGSFLDIMDGKFGPYFRCMNCGNINFRKGVEMNEERIKRMAEPDIKRKKAFQEINSRATKENTGPKEVVVRSDELDFMYE